MTDQRRHNGGPLSEDDARILWDHVRAREVLDEQKAEIALDIKARKDLIKADGFDNNIVDVILKRRKTGAGMTREADNLVWLYESALEEQGALPLEQTRKARAAAERRTTEEIADDLHAQSQPVTLN